MNGPHADLSVVIPVFNERRRLAATLAAVLAAAGDRWELIVVDDGSVDGSGALARTLTGHDPRVRVIGSPVNRGKGHAVRLGVCASRGRLVLFTDADLATPIEELDRLRERLGHGYAAAIGTRSGADRHPARDLAGRAGNRLIRTLATPGFHDTQCGFKLFDGEKARAAFGAALIDGWAFDVEILRMFARYGWPVAQVPVRWTDRPGSTVRPGAYLRALSDLARIRLAYGRPGDRREPPRLAAPAVEAVR